jgi:hypothetical protein
MILKLARFLSLVLLVLFCAYLTFISGISFLIGLTNMNRSGFWMPILCGFLLLILISFLVRLIVFIIRGARSRDKRLYV